MLYKKYIEKTKLHTILIFLFTLIVIMSVALTAVPSFYLIRGHILGQISESRGNVLSQISNNIVNIQDDVITLSDLFFNNPSVNHLANLDHLSEMDNRSYLSELVSVDQNVHQTLSNYNFDYKFQLQLFNGFSYASDTNDLVAMKLYSKQLWYMDALNSKDDLFWLPSLTLAGVSPTEENYFALIRKLRATSGETTGLVIICVNEKTLYEVYQQQLTDKNSIYLIDNQGRIVSHRTETMIGRLFYDMAIFNQMFSSNSTIIQKLGEDYIFSRHSNPGMDWIVIEEIPLRNIFQPFTKIGIYIFLISLTTIVIGAAFSVLIARNISKPLLAVYDAMQKAQDGNFSVSFPQIGFSETNGIAQSCELFVKKIVHLLDDVKFNEQERHKLELAFLQAQINPHFLYNTLFTIRCMIDMGLKEESCTMIDSLTKILKATLGNISQVVTIGEEMDLLHQYGIILQKRYKGLFKLDFTIDQSTIDYPILRFILQPLLENAVFHGFTSMKKGGLIQISTQKVLDQIIIRIKDNGCGMSKETLASVMDLNSSGYQIGIKNVYKRIQLHYEDAASFSISSELGHGTEFEIIIPAVKSDIKNLE